MLLVSALESVRVGLGALRIHPARTFLSTLGVLIGAMALTATFAVIDGVDVMARAVLLRESSIQDVFVTPRTTNDPDLEERLHTRASLTLEDLAAARRSIPLLADASLTLSGTTVISYRSHRRRTNLVLATANVPTLEDVTVLAGRFYNEIEVSHGIPVVVLGHQLASELAAPLDPLVLIGRSVRLQGSLFKVIGVLTPRVEDRDLVAFSPLSLGTDLVRTARRRQWLAPTRASVQSGQPQRCDRGPRGSHRLGCRPLWLGPWGL